MARRHDLQCAHRGRYSVVELLERLVSFFDDTEHVLPLVLTCAARGASIKVAHGLNKPQHFLPTTGKHDQSRGIPTCPEEHVKFKHRPQATRVIWAHDGDKFFAGGQECGQRAEVRDNLGIVLVARGVEPHKRWSPMLGLKSHRPLAQNLPLGLRVVVPRMRNVGVHLTKLCWLRLARKLG
eukprot:3869354-Prymnesium_polylepis.1